MTKDKPKYIREHGLMDRLHNAAVWTILNMPKLLKKKESYVGQNEMRQQIKDAIEIMTWGKPDRTVLPSIANAGDNAVHGKVIGYNGLNLERVTISGRKMVKVTKHSINESHLMLARLKEDERRFRLTCCCYDGNFTEFDK